MNQLRYRSIADQLNVIEEQLRYLGFWQDVRPSSEQLVSELPFCHDTLEFPQWLQFVFLERMRLLIDAQAPLPAACGITPYAQEFFKGSERKVQTLLGHLSEIDRLLSE
ncbi:MAG: YqcC family protein [Gammaproteobacteria bacterium]